MREGEEAALLDELMEIPKFGSGIGLHRVMALCHEILDTPWMRSLDAIKVTGSNGKGSVCAMTSAILAELGISHGLYVSPHLLTFHERIVLDRRPISSEDLAVAIRWVLARRNEYAARNPGDHVGAFEAFTAMALFHYERMRPETLVVEAGIGGRYDPVRVAPGFLTALTSLDLEHAEVLGSTLDLIAYDKADLCPDGGVLVAGDMGSQVRRRLEAYCRIRDINLVDIAEKTRLHSLVFDGERMTASIEVPGHRFDDLVIALPGPHQASNAAVSILLVQEWLARHRPGLEAAVVESSIRRGLAAVQWPGRFQKVGSDPDIFVDVGHTPGAVASLVETAGAVLKGRRILLVTGVSYDKQVEAIVSALLPLADRVVCARAYHKGSKVPVIAEIVQRHRPEIPMEIEERIEDAMARAVERAREHDMVILVAGGLFLSIEAMQALRGADPQALRFF